MSISHSGRTLLALCMSLGLLLATVPDALAFSSGAPICAYPCGTMGAPQPGTGSFSVTVEDGNGNQVADYIPGETYTVVLSNAQTTFRGLIIQSVQGNLSQAQFNSNGVGFFQSSASTRLTTACTNSSSSVTHNTGAQRTEERIDWIAPFNGVGDITFLAAGVVVRFDWYGMDANGGKNISWTLTENTLVDAPPALPVAKLQVVPNPANPRAEVKLTLPNYGPATLNIYDARGQKVKTLYQGWLDAGEQSFIWSGVDDSGRPAASGAYLAVLRGAGNASARITLIR